MHSSLQLDIPKNIQWSFVLMRMLSAKGKPWFLPSLCLLFCCLCLLYLHGYRRLSDKSVVVFHFKDTINDSVANDACTIDTCVDLLPCAIFDNRLTVYIEPLIKVVDEHGREITPRPSREYLNLRSIIEQSEYHVGRIEDACLVLPGFDTLSIHRFPYPMALRHALAADGRFGNRTLVLFLFAGSHISPGKALVARSQTLDASFRYGYDVAVPFWFSGFPPMATKAAVHQPFSLSILLKGMAMEEKADIIEIFKAHDGVVILGDCVGDERAFCSHSGELGELNEMLERCGLTMIFDKASAFEWSLMTTLRSFSIPVIISDRLSLPFAEVIDWSSFSYTFHYDQLPALYNILSGIGPVQLRNMKTQGRLVYEKYFSSLEKVVLMTLKVLQDRVVASSITFASEWNLGSVPPQLFLPRTEPLEGFTAVISTKGRLESLFTWLRIFSKIRSLISVVVIWNAVDHFPPPESEWPHFGRKVHVIIMRNFHSSNRFINFKEIKTEAVFAVCDDTEILTASQIEFGYQLWRENPNRLIHYLGDSLNLYNATLSFAASSSFVDLMPYFHGGFFYHKYFGVLYHKALSTGANILASVPEVCEDMAMVHFVRDSSALIVIKVHLEEVFCAACSAEHHLPLATEIYFKRVECTSRMAVSSFYYEAPHIHFTSFNP